MTRWLVPWLLLLLAGCHALQPDINPVLCGRAEHPIDLPVAEPVAELPAPKFGVPDGGGAKPEAPRDDTPGRKVGAAKAPRTLSERLQIPPGIPGGRTPDIRLPPASAPREQIDAAMKKYFPPLPPVAPTPRTSPGPDGHPVTLVELQKIAQTNSPVIRQAALDVEAARGNAVQAGLYPNPTFGYEGDAVGQANSPGMQGGFLAQTVKTAGKLKLSRAAALVEMHVNEMKLRGAEAELRAQVRAGYFNVLSARKNVEVAHALAGFTDEVYQVLLLQLKAGEVAAYEPMQIRVLALQARGQAIQAHNRYVSAWKQLAATLGLPGMPLTELAGRIDMPIPRYRYDAVLARVLSRHSDVVAAQMGIDKARLNVQLAQVMPIPDVDFRVMLQHDYTTPPFQTVTSVVMQAPIPVFDRNQGNVYQARANLQRAIEESHRVRNALTTRVADAFERYENNRLLLELYRDQMLPNQVQAYRAAVARHSAVGEKGGVSYYDLVTSQQSLSGLITSYLSALRDQWQSVSDLSNLLQTDDLFQGQEMDPVAPVPDLHTLPPVGSVAPCNPLPDPVLRTGDGTWPAAVEGDIPPVAEPKR
jgi:cobalt-zinc-cadmium efflux system outer membrane protein